MGSILRLLGASGGEVPGIGCPNLAGLAPGFDAQREGSQPGVHESQSDLASTFLHLLPQCLLDVSGALTSGIFDPKPLANLPSRVPFSSDLCVQLAVFHADRLSHNLVGTFFP